MSEPTDVCRECGSDLLFSARARGNGLCGPCTRAPALMAARAGTLEGIRAAACSVPGVVRCMAELEPSGCDVTAVIVIDDAHVNREEVRAAIKDASPIYVATRIIFAVEVPDALVPPPVKVAIFDNRYFMRVYSLATAAEARAFADGAHASPRSTVSVYILPEEEAEMRNDQDAGEVGKAMEAMR